MSDSRNNPAPGWYADPTNPGTERWWDGTAWGQESRAANTSPPPPQATTTGGSILGAQPQPAGPNFATPSPGQEKRGGCFGIAGGVMAGIIGAVVLLVGGCTALVVVSVEAADDDLVSIETSTTSVNDSGQTEPTDSQGDPQESAEPSGNSESDDVISCVRVDADTIELEVVNNSPKTSSYLLTIGFFDDSGQRLADEAAFLNYLRPGERAIEKQFVFEEQGTVCEVIDVDRFAAESIASEVAEVSACEIGPEADVFGDFQATISATNSSPETSTYVIEVAFVDADGIRRGTGSTFIEAVRPDETAPGELFSSTEYSDGYSCEVIGVTRNAT